MFIIIVVLLLVLLLLLGLILLTILSVGRRGYRTFEIVCLFVCPQHNSKTKDPKVFKLGIGNDLGMS